MRRKANFEILRIISMGMIVTLHYFSHGGGYTQIAHGSFAYYIMQSIIAMAQVGVDCFVLISSYFMIDKTFSLSRIINTFANTIFYSILGLSVFVAFSTESIGLKDIVYSLFPVTSSQYWFITQYVLLLFFSPLINKALINMTEDTLKKITVIFVILFSIIPTVLPWSRYYISSGKNISWFVTLYLVAACLKKIKMENRCKHCLRVFFIISFFVAVVDDKLVLLMNALGNNLSTVLYYNNSPNVLICAILLMMWANKMNVESKLSDSIVNFGGKVFGVYLFHDNPLIRTLLWNQIGKLFIYGEWGFVLNLPISLLLIFLIGLFIETIRKKIFNCLKIDTGIKYLSNYFTTKLQLET